MPIFIPPAILRRAAGRMSPLILRGSGVEPTDPTDPTEPTEPPPPPTGYRYWGFELYAGGTAGTNRLSLLRWSTSVGTPNQQVTNASMLFWRPTAPATILNPANALDTGSGYLEYSKNPSPHLIYADFGAPRDDIALMQFRFTTSAYQGTQVRAAKSNDAVNWIYGTAAVNAGNGAWLNIIVNAPPPP